MAKKKSKFIEDFKAFAFKGNVVDMAVGVVIGGAFGSIVTSLVNDIIMPLVGLLTGGTDFSNLQAVLSSHVDEATGETVIDSAVRYGQFIQYILNFLIVAFCIFVVVRILTAGKRKKEAEEAAKKAEEEKKAAEEAANQPKEPTEAELLAEIVELLKNK